jgi:hypothetical protein
MLVSGPIGTLLVAGASVLALVVWLVRRPRHPGPRLVGHDGIDRAALEAAEREVRDLGTMAHPDDGFEHDDWGPGTARPRSPMPRPTSVGSRRSTSSGG